MPPRNFMAGARPTTVAAEEAALATLLLPTSAVRSADIPIDLIRPNPFQARKRFPDLDELAQVIQAQGFISRLRVRPDPTEAGAFQLVFGERRLRAARLAGLPAIPCDIADHSDDDMIEIGLAENIQRQDLDPLEEAQALQIFIAQRGYSIRRLAERLGKDRGYIENRLALLKLPADVQQLVAQRPDAIDAARRIGKLATPDERAPLIDAVAQGELSAQAVRSIVREHVRSGPGDTQSTVRRRIAADGQIIAAIVQRWASLLHEQPPAQLPAAIAEQLDALEAQLQLLRELVGSTKSD